MEEASLIKGGVEVVKQIGFPIAVAFWFMFRTDKLLQNMTQAFTDMRLAIEANNALLEEFLHKRK